MSNVELITAWLLFFVAICAAVGSTLVIIRGANKKLEHRITETITRATYPIQPKSNGGFSMTDLHKKVDLLTDRQTVIAQQVADHLLSHDKDVDNG